MRHLSNSRKRYVCFSTISSISNEFVYLFNNFFLNLVCLMFLMKNITWSSTLNSLRLSFLFANLICDFVAHLKLFLSFFLRFSKLTMRFLATKMSIFDSSRCQRKFELYSRNVSKRNIFVETCFAQLYTNCVKLNNEV